MSKQLILSVRPYDFENARGEKIQGARIAYLNKKSSTRENESGYPPLIVTVSDKTITDSIKEVPGIYDMDFEQVTGKNNKPEIVLTGLEFVKPINIPELFELKK